MGCEVLAYDLFQSKEAIEMGVKYVDTVEELLPKCQIVTLHCPLMDDTYHLMNDEKFNLMKRGSMLVNTSRGGLVDTAALGRALDTQKIACVGMDVYEHEAGLFFEDKSEETDATPGVVVVARLGPRVECAGVQAQRAGDQSPGVSHRRGAGKHRGDDGG